MGKADKHTKRFQEKLQRVGILNPLKNRPSNRIGFHDITFGIERGFKFVNDLMKNK